MLKVGITGGIGCGKTTVAKVFEVLGIPVYSSDLAARHLVNTDPALKKQIIEAFGNESYSNNELNRKHIANIVFNDTQKLDLLNSFIHPVTILDAEKWMKKQTAAYCIKEAAILFESNSYKGLNYIIGVSAPLSLRIKRTIIRDSISEEEVKKRIARQMDEEEKMKKCDFIIYNDDLQAIIPQVLNVHQQVISDEKQHR